MSSLMRNIASIEYRRFKSVCTNDLKFSVADNVSVTRSAINPNSLYHRIELYKDRMYDNDIVSTMYVKLEMAYDETTEVNPYNVLIQARISVVKNYQLRDMYKRSEDVIFKRAFDAFTPNDIGQAINIILGTVDVDCELGPFV